MSHNRRRGVTLIEMLVVVAILGIMTSITYPSITAGLDSLRLATAGDDVASLFASAANFAERRQQPVEIRISPHTIEATAGRFNRRLDLDNSLTITGDPRSVFIDPAALVPGVTIEIHSNRGSRKFVRIDPISGVAEVK